MHHRPDDRLFELAYEELRRIARRRHFVGRAPDAIQASALVHETYIRFRDRFHTLTARTGGDRSTFLRMATLVMKTVARDRWRMRHALRRGGIRPRTVEASKTADPRGHGLSGSTDLLALDEALDRLQQRYPQWFEVLQQRDLAGRTVGETARLLGIDRPAVRGRRRSALRWLRGEMDP
jgi:RNA polymerase sigma factor (TIGR02999 family)